MIGGVSFNSYASGRPYSTVHCDTCMAVLNSGHHYAPDVRDLAKQTADEHNREHHPEPEPADVTWGDPRRPDVDCDEWTRVVGPDRLGRYGVEVLSLTGNWITCGYWNDQKAAHIAAGTVDMVVNLHRGVTL